MHAPQVVYVAFAAASLGCSLVSHGKVDPKPDSFWHAALAFGILTGLLYWGGFFK